MSRESEKLSQTKVVGAPEVQEAAPNTAPGKQRFPRGELVETPSAQRKQDQVPT